MCALFWVLSKLGHVRHYLGWKSWWGRGGDFEILDILIGDTLFCLISRRTLPVKSHGRAGRTTSKTLLPPSSKQPCCFHFSIPLHAKSLARVLTCVMSFTPASEKQYRDGMSHNDKKIELRSARTMNSKRMISSSAAKAIETFPAMM